MTKAATRSRTALGPLDFLLSGIASCLAAYSTGVGLGLPNVGYVFVVGIAAGTIFSMLVQSFAGDDRSVLGGLLYTLVVVLAAIVARNFNGFLPDGGFPRELMISGVLSWMLLFGSFTAWRDSTMLFQAVPSIALFGLVGSWDTFKASPVAFFAFLLCLATLFGRVHGRAMVRQAEASGYKDVDQLSSTAWRWMAGPEWALASAAAVILVSLVGAPILQESVKGFTDAIKVNVPTPPAVRAAINAARQQVGRTRVGTGPVELGTEEVFRVRMSEPNYLRTQIFDLFDGRNWGNSYIGWQKGLVAQNPDLRDKAVRTIKDPKEFDFEVELTTPMSYVPVPGEVVSIDVLPAMRALPDGTFAINSNQDREGKLIGGTSIEAKNPRIARDAYNDLVNSWSENIPPRVVELARSVTAGAKTDMEKALAIKREIENRCTYNLNVEAVPAGQDAVEYFLFESKEGYCDLFGSAMAMMARAVNLPSRYSVGYFPIKGEMDHGKWVLREGEYHAWADIFFEGAGWVVFDATEGAVVAPGSERGGGNRGSMFRSIVVWGTVGGVSLLGGGWLLFMFIGRTRRHEQPDIALLHKQEAGRLYARFAKMLEKKSGKPRKLSQTAFEYLDSVAPNLGAGEAEARRLNDRFVQTLYGRPRIDDSLLTGLREQLVVVKKALAAKSKA